MSPRGGAPGAVLDEAVGRFEGGSAAAATDFTAAAKFLGARPGFVFGTGAQGVGYYRDARGRGTPPAAAGAMAAPPPRAPAPRAPRDAAALLREAEAEAAAGGAAAAEPIDARGARRAAAALERAFRRNVEARAKHAGDPARFLESELELDEAVRGLAPVASAPGLYAELLAAGAPATLLALLPHENGDVAAAALELLAELVGADAAADDPAAAAALLDALLAGGLLPALAARLAALDESVPEEAAAAHHALAVVEAGAELRAEFAAAAAAEPGLLEWVLARLRPTAELNEVKVYAAEVLAVLLQAGGDAARARFAAAGGVDLLLTAVAPYRARDPASPEEEALLEDAFDALCTALMLPAARAAFVAGEGVELALLMLRRRGRARGPALRALDFATTGDAAACDRLVDAGGLGAVFAAFMGRRRGGGGGGGGRRADAAAAEEAEERAVSVVASLAALATGAERRDRVSAKFVEAEYEKCDRLMEVFERYAARVEAAERRAAAEDAEDAEEALAARLGAGLSTLQAAALVAGGVWARGDAGARRRLLALLHQRGRSLAALRGALLELRAALGDDGGDGARAAREAHLDAILASLGHAPPGEGGEAAAYAEAAEVDGAEAEAGEAPAEAARKRRRSDEGAE
jgi:beta-catenin-like protein 1